MSLKEEKDEEEGEGGRGMAAIIILDKNWQTVKKSHRPPGPPWSTERVPGQPVGGGGDRVHMSDGPMACALPAQST